MARFQTIGEAVVFYRYHPRAITLWPVGTSRFDSLSDTLRRSQGRVYFAGDTHSNGATQPAIRVVKDILQLLP